MFRNEIPSSIASTMHRAGINISPLNACRNPWMLLRCVPSPKPLCPQTVRYRGTIAAVDLKSKETVEQSDADRPVRIATLVGEGSVSPLRNATWEEVMTHTAKRMKWVDEGYDMVVTTDSIISDDEKAKHLQKALNAADILLIVAVTKSESASWIRAYSKNVPNIICFDCAPGMRNKLGGQYVDGADDWSPSAKAKESKQVVKTVSEAWGRQNSDDIRFCLLVIVNAYVKPVEMLKNLRGKGLSTLTCMVRNCGSQILKCLMDPSCRKALQCLNRCGAADQVCTYRCIASYESPNLEAFSLCVLQKHNCLQLNAEVPTKPYVPPLQAFRGEPMTAEMAEDLFVGWLGRLKWSWRVVAGQNPAYDQFPCQYQLFYRGKAKGTLWYEPVFRVKTLEGNVVWRRRKYRVKRGKVPGTFDFSVLDNGVVSKEFWTVVDVADDFSWGLFHYSGAAAAAGQSYTGAVLVSPDGGYPSEYQRLSLALERCEIKEWELFYVDNFDCEDPPLGVPEGSTLHSAISFTTSE